MANLLPTLLLGIILGMRHATDADHVVAVTTIVTRQRRVADAMRIGALWGVGHTVTILLVGGAISVSGRRNVTALSESSGTASSKC